MDVQLDITNTRLETPRLLLRPWKESDLNDFHAYASVAGVGEMAGWKHHKSMEITKTVLQSFITGKNVFAIEYKDNGKVIGSLGFHDTWANADPKYKDYKMKEIGYVLSKTYWGRGLMTEAVKEVIDFCSANALDALTVGHFSGNDRSKRVIEKCGFQFVKQREYIAKQLQKTFVCMAYILPLSDSVPIG